MDLQKISVNLTASCGKSIGVDPAFSNKRLGTKPFLAFEVIRKVSHLCVRVHPANIVAKSLDICDLRCSRLHVLGKSEFRFF